MDDDAESIITGERYNYIGNIIEDCYKKRVKKQMSLSDKIDSIVTNRFLALPIFAVVMFLVYYVSVTTVGSILTDWTNDTLFGEWILPAAQGALESVGCADWLTGLIAVSYTHLDVYKRQVMPMCFPSTQRQERCWMTYSFLMWEI